MPTGGGIGGAAGGGRSPKAADYNNSIPDIVSSARGLGLSRGEAADLRSELRDFAKEARHEGMAPSEFASRSSVLAEEYVKESSAAGEE